jgi:hypothetical protein
MKTLVSLVGTKWLSPEVVQLAASLPAGEPLTLVRDPRNAVDTNAIMVFARSRHIGYVKATEAQYLAQRMDERRDRKPGTPLRSAPELPGKLMFDGTRWPLIEIEEPL